MRQKQQRNGQWAVTRRHSVRYRPGSDYASRRAHRAMHRTPDRPVRGRPPAFHHRAEGDQSWMRLMLRPTDIASVEDLGLPYTVTAEAGFALLQIEKFPVSAGLVPEEITLLLRLPP